jgi:hypothetical protein
MIAVAVRSGSEPHRRDLVSCPEPRGVVGRYLNLLDRLSLRDRSGPGSAVIEPADEHVPVGPAAFDAVRELVFTSARSCAMSESSLRAPEGAKQSRSLWIARTAAQSRDDDIMGARTYDSSHQVPVLLRAAVRNGRAGNGGLSLPYAGSGALRLA